ncbi:PREDICTED: pre-mRNA-splicing factor CWC25 homolog [Acromyrmex echinatior]|uniref:pre-mRNA-splicing factor CWC25 homolog n=1 Tax=Acromyrmex echinatior TaxID=103372 RepID=UPI000580D232|nr:PREDICTED: pre-mRNA-splicing factor CWC25 homolog [Acromyrmex echinatior]
MGGGDLNLKKSWHPSTMKNIEKVRKAEQQNDQENKRIAELKKEIEMEKDLEDIKKYAIEQGVIEKKDDMKLDWMYKGPNQMVDREEYLLGRPVDKAFEQMQQAEKDSEMNRMPKNHVEYGKLDTLEQPSKTKSDKKKKKSLHKLMQSDSSEDEAKLDVLLATKYKQLKDINEKYLLKSMKKIKRNKTKKSKKHHDSDSEIDNSNDDTSIKRRRHKQRKQKKSKSDSDDNTDSNSKNITKRETEYDRKYSRNDTRLDDTKNQDRKRKLSEDRNSKYERSQKHGEEDNKRPRYDSKQRDDSRNKYNDKRRYSMEKERTIFNSGRTSAIRSIPNTDHIKFKDRQEEKYRSKTRPSLTEEEKEQRRKEMMANAVWRDKEREKNVKMYREQEKKEEQNITLNNKDFIRKQLVIATEMGTVASRIKANLNNIQRSGRAMDTNFAKR